MTTTARRLARIALRLTMAGIVLLVLGVTCALAFPGLMFVIFMGVFGLGDPAWPSISEPDALVAECGTLVDRVMAGQLRNEHPQRRASTPSRPIIGPTILPEHWPAHVQELTPIRVYVDVDEASCSFMISSGGIRPGWGYGVYPKPGASVPSSCDDPPRCGGRYVWTTSHDRIVKWEDFEG